MLTHPGSAYDAIRKSAVSAAVPRSILLLEGDDTFGFLHRMSTNDLATLAEGSAVRTVLVNEKGRVVDLVTVGRTGRTALLVGSPGSAHSVAAWLDRFIITDDVRISLRAESPALPAIFGPGAPGIVARQDFSALAVREDFGTIPGYLIIPSDPRQGDADAGHIPELAGIERIDSGILDVVRIEEKLPAAGRELGPEVNALEAGLKQYISFSKGCYIGQEVIARLDTYKKLHSIIALFRIECDERRVPRPGILLQGGRKAGRLTSMAYSPLNGGWIGLGFRDMAIEHTDFELKQEEPGAPVRCTCISGLPRGYEEYEIAH